MAEKTTHGRAPAPAEEQSGSPTTAEANWGEFEFLRQRPLTPEQEAELVPLIVRWEALKRLWPYLGTLPPAKAEAAKREHDELWAALSEFISQRGLIAPSQSPPPLVETLRQRVRKTRALLEVLRNASQGDVLLRDADFLQAQIRDVWAQTREMLESEDRPEEPEVKNLIDADNALDRLEAALASAASKAEASPTPAAPSLVCSPDYRSVRWGKEGFTFTEKQAACIRVLDQVRQEGTPELSQVIILDRAESAMADKEKPKLHALFRGHPAWRRLIVKGTTKGSYRLDDPPA